MKRMAGRLALSKFVVVEYVTLSFECIAVAGSHKAWWKCFVHVTRIAWSSADKEDIVVRIQCSQMERRPAGHGREQARQDTVSRLAKYLKWGIIYNRVVPCVHVAVLILWKKALS
jgi:hypothetical protein